MVLEIAIRAMLLQLESRVGMRIRRSLLLFEEILHQHNPKP